MIEWYWYIAIFIGLILFNRVVLLVFSAHSLRWSKLKLSAMYLNGKSKNALNWNESGEIPTTFIDEFTSGSTGLTPGGLSWEVPTVGFPIKGSDRKDYQ